MSLKLQVLRSLVAVLLFASTLRLHTEAHTGLSDSAVDQNNDKIDFTIFHEGNRTPAWKNISGRHLSPAGPPHMTTRYRIQIQRWTEIPPW